MKNKLLLAVTVAILSACGGGSSDNGSASKPDKSVDISNLTGLEKSVPKGKTVGMRIYPIYESSNYSHAVSRNLVNRPSKHAQNEINKVLVATNKLRQEKGLKPLKLDDNLSAYAMKRANETAISFEHLRLDYTYSVDNPNSHGEGYFGENLAATDNKSSEDVVSVSWRNSKGHYENIIKPEYERIGIGYYEINGIRYYTQIFASGSMKSHYEFSNEVIKNLSSSDVGYALKYNFNLNQLSSAQTIYLPSYQRKLQFIDGRAQGWQYQNIARVTEADGKTIAYLNVGVERFIPDEDANFKALYRGKAFGDYQNINTQADIAALIDFSKGKKEMTLNVYNNKVAGKSASNLDFNTKLNWDGDKFYGRRSGNVANFFGPSASEISGQFNQEIDKKVYRGAFGGKKQ